MNRDDIARRTLAVVCADWPVTVLRSVGRLPREGAVAVVAEERILATSPEARGEGVRPGQRRREAQARCPQLVVARRDPGGEVQAFEPVVEVLESFGALVATREPGWAGLETRGPARYFGGEAALVAAVDAALAGASLPGRWWGIGLGDGAFVATQAARSRLLIPRGHGAAFLAPFETAVLDRPELADVLGRLGITTLGAFAALGEAEVLARFGTDGARAHRLARGLEGEVLRVRRRRRDLSVSAKLDPPAEGAEAMAFVAKGLAEQLAGRLVAGGLACTRLKVELVTTDGERLTRAWTGDGPVRPAVVAERLRWQLEAWIAGGTRATRDTGAREDDPVPGAGGGRGATWETGEVRGGEGVAEVTLVPEEVIADRGRQLDLWSRSQAGDERAARAVARVQGMLGVTAVVRAVPAGGRGPAERVRLLPFGDIDPHGERSSPPEGRATERGHPPPPWPGRLPAPSPSVVTIDPVPATLRDGHDRPVAVDGRGAISAPPAVLALEGHDLPVRSWAGPWPVDERWWEGGARCRRARLQVVTASGRAYLVALEQGTWLVEAAYD